MENKKQTIIKIVCIVIIVAVICFFFLFFRNDNVKTGDSLIPPNDKTEEKPNTKPDPDKYTKFPKYSSLYKKNSQITNIGGRGEENYLNSFLLNDEILLLVETSSDNFDFDAKNKSIAIAKLNKNLDLLSTKTLEKTSGTKYIASTVFCDGILLIVTNQNNTTVLLYDYEFKLTDFLTFEPIEYATVFQDINYIKIITYENNTISYRIIDEGLNIVAFVKTNSSCDGFCHNILPYRNNDVFISYRQNYFDVYKVTKKIDIDDIYYVIERICSVKGIYSQLLIDKIDMTKIYISYLNNNKASIISVDTKNGNTQNKELNIASNGNQVIPLDNGYILHNYIDDTINIFDDSFNIIISNLHNKLQNAKINYSFYLPESKEYYFIADSTLSANTLLCCFDASYSSKVVLEIPKLNGKIDIKISNITKYLFLTTNNNVNEFNSCYGGNDIFVIKLSEELN